MGRIDSSATRAPADSGYYRLTANGRACVDLVETGGDTAGPLSRYLHDVLMMCGSGMWFEQLRQFMPPRSLEESLQALLALGLIECQVSAEPRRPVSPAPGSAQRSSRALRMASAWA